MSAIASKPLDTRDHFLRSIVVGGLLIGTLDAIVYHLIISSLMRGYPLISVYQYIASGAMGGAAFEGGISTALLGLFFHFVFSFAVAAVFIVSADRMPFLRRNAILGSLVYGLCVWIVMNMIVIPLSGTPELPAPTVPVLIIDILDHVLVVGLPLGLLVRRNANAHK
ncbi:MAG: hypothetical protein KJ065_21915 [Anaerolineae bacterium]|nr:hypothetical protein [Anaerolineae bacterium]